MSCLDGGLYITSCTAPARQQDGGRPVDLQNSSSKISDAQRKREGEGEGGRTPVDNDCEIKETGGRGYANDGTSHVQKSR